MQVNEDMLSADKLLFAVDLVDYIIIKTRPNFANKTLDILERVDRLRNFTCNRFNKTIKKALNVLDTNQDRSVYNNFQKMMAERRVNKESFTEYANSYRKQHLPDEFHAKSFLMYCDRVANMAGYFLSFGVEDASDVAVELIMQAFPKSVTYFETWTKLNNAAQTLSVIGSDYYEGNMSSGSSSESLDSTSSDSVNMEVSAKSPEDMTHRNLFVASDILRETSEHIKANNGPARVNVISISKPSFEVKAIMNNQSTNSASSPVVSCIKYPSNDTNLEEVYMSNNGS